MDWSPPYPLPFAMPARFFFARPDSGAPLPQQRPLAALVVPLMVLLVASALPARAGVRFENCLTAADGSITCDTVPTGNTMMQDVDARYGLFDNASPGWNEFDPFAGYEDEFGGNQT